MTRNQTHIILPAAYSSRQRAPSSTLGKAAKPSQPTGYIKCDHFLKTYFNDASQPEAEKTNLDKNRTFFLKQKQSKLLIVTAKTISTGH